MKDVPDGDAAVKPGRALVLNAARATSSARGSRFVMLAAVVALAAGIGAILGSTGYASIARVLSADPLPVEILNDTRSLKSDVAQLKKDIKTTSDQIGALRVSLNQSSAAATAQFNKIGEALERAEKRHASVPAQTPDVTSGATAAAGALPRPAGVTGKPIPGWIVRRVYDGMALIEGRGGIVEAELGAVIPELGRVQEIRRENGRWLVVTSKGLITSR